MSKFYGIVFFLLVADYASATINQYVFEFGQDSGTVVNKYEGTIPLLQLNTNVDIVAPPGVKITYLRVTVNAVSSPKVDYQADTSRLTIRYDFTQITWSTYSIVVKGVYT